MSVLLTAAAMRAVEAAAIAGGGVTGRGLMARAGAAVVDAVLAAWPDLAAGRHRVLVLTGPGNNGGDGFVIARDLADRGWSVDLALFGDAGRRPLDAGWHHARLPAGVRQLALVPGEGLAVGPADLVVDALFGTGLTRPLTALAPLLAQLGRMRGARIVAVDIPSGICADSGRPLVGADGRPLAVRADLTVSFHRAKPGHYLAAGPEYCGRLVVADIGLDAAGADDGDAGPGRVLLVDPPPAALLAKSGGAHKYDHGHALILGGGPGQGGAARLAARAALRVGAGLVTLAVPPAALAENAAQLEAVMLRPLAGPAALRELLADRRLRALCLGPGLGLGKAAAALLAAALGDGDRRPMVLDADALTLLARQPGLAAGLHADCLLLPHDGEFARLWPELAARLMAPAGQGPAWSRLDAARAAAADLGCTVLLKGPATVIAAPDGRAAIHAAVYDQAAPWLATAGAGDVLAGLATGLLARGHGPFAAATIAAWLHAAAARRLGPGLIAEDLPRTLPAVLRDLGA